MFVIIIIIYKFPDCFKMLKVLFYSVISFIIKLVIFYFIYKNSFKSILHVPVIYYLFFGIQIFLLLLIVYCIIWRFNLNCNNLLYLSHFFHFMYVM